MADNYELETINVEGKTIRLTDKQLTERFNAEVTNRENADIALQSQITACQSAYNTLQGNINSEAATRASADAVLRQAIDDAAIVPAGSTVVVDSTLSITGAAADAKVTGDKITDLKNAVNSELDFLALEQGTYNPSTGSPVSNSKYVRSFNKIVNPTHINTKYNSVYVAGVFVFNNDGSFSEYINAGQQITDIDVVPGSGKYAFVSFISTDGSDITPSIVQPNMTITNLIVASKETSANTQTLKDTKNVTREYKSGYAINNSGALNTVVNVTPVSNASTAYVIIPCKYKDKFTITGTGGKTYRLWCFVDANYRSKAVAASDATAENLELYAPVDGYFISNVTVSNTYSLSVVQRMDLKGMQTTLDDTVKRVNALAPEYAHITDPHLLFWKMGTFNSDGPQTGTFTDRMYTVCKVKKGSRIVAGSSGGVKINFGYKLSESDASLSGYKTFAYYTIDVEQDCIMYLGVMNSPATYLRNDSLLDNVTVDLYVVDFETKYRKDRAFGSVPFGHYVGQHTDDTGWDNSTADIDAIHAAFDALVTASDGWLTKKDLGVAYDTYHMYQYDTVPVGLHAGRDGINIPKVAVVCCEHGNEKMSAYAMHYLMYDLIHNPSKNPILYYLRSNCAISFIPIANPWGFINTSRLNENGVNLNRNFPTYNWNEYSDETSDAGGINYKGTAPASETQTQLIMQFLRNNFDAVFAIDLHTNGENTSAWYEVSTAILNADASADSPNYDVQKSYYIPSKLNTNYIKSWMDENYGSSLGNVFYGNVTFPEVDRPTTGQWVRESNNMVGITYEILCGSADGYLGANLGKYAPATIKAAAEELGDYIVAMIANCKEQ